MKEIRGRGGELLRLRKGNQDLWMEKVSYLMRILCRVLEVSRSGYYARRNRKPSAQMLEDDRLQPKIVAAFKAGRGTHGSPRVRDELAVLAAFAIARTDSAASGPPP